MLRLTQYLKPYLFLILITIILLFVQAKALFLDFSCLGWFLPSHKCGL